jgi:hypothetical protein
MRQWLLKKDQLKNPYFVLQNPGGHFKGKSLGKKQFSPRYFRSAGGPRGFG